ncbi:hypothetical protein CBR_g39700 [Chara braunii]|uniref:Uncharacterized protein n=1 Tax=Chara braunii TaxID=69332 RepID=A0A388LS30_CHABU|nr:hypothetical protein CBR_g39700 [Chara braunii]|eukprot:GBG85134.1 hypothetical protein CBR_g39700 [Chara braunii]
MLCSGMSGRAEVKAIAKGVEIPTRSPGSYQVRIDSHLSTTTLFHDVEDSPRRSTQHTCPVQDDTLLVHLLEEGECLQCAATSVQGPSVGVLETEPSECEGHALELTHAVQRDDELLQGSSENAINIGDTDLVLHSGSPLTTQERDGKGGYGTFVEGKNRGREGLPCTFWEGRLCGDGEDKEERVLETQLNDDEEGEGAVGVAQLFGGDVSALLHDGEAGEAQLYAGEVSGRLHVSEVLARHIGSKQTDHDSTSTNCGEEQGDRAPALSSGREMVLHEATELVSDTAAIEMVSDSAVVEMQNIESSTDVSTVA